MNFSELKTELFARGTDYLNEDSAGVARAERWLNEAYREILNLNAWPFLQAITTGTAGAGLVSVPDLRRIRFVADASDGGTPGRVLQRATLEDLVENDDADTTTTGTPNYYYVEGGNTVYGYPLGGTIRVYYFKRVNPMSGTDTPVFSEEYHGLIVDRAMMKVYKDSDNFEASAALKQEYDAGVLAMAEDYLRDSRGVQFISVNPYDG